MGISDREPMSVLHGFLHGILHGFYVGSHIGSYIACCLGFHTGSHIVSYARSYMGSHIVSYMVFTSVSAWCPVWHAAWLVGESIHFFLCGLINWSKFPYRNLYGVLHGWEVRHFPLDSEFIYETASEYKKKPLFVYRQILNDLGMASERTDPSLGALRVPLGIALGIAIHVRARIPIAALSFGY